MNTKFLLLISITAFIFCSCSVKTELKQQVSDLLRPEIILRGDDALGEEPVTITSFVAERSAGGIHDFYSEGDYWWPNPLSPDSAYIRRDGETNPDNFVAHRHAMIRFSTVVGDLTSAWIVTKDTKYIEQALKHVHAWFIDPETSMNPDLQYAQAIKGIVTGRGIGIIDTIHLMEVVQSLIVMEQNGLLSAEEAVATKDWFSKYLHWLTNHPYGKDEMNAKNNHGTCWVMQAALFAKYTGNTEVLEFCRERYRNVLLPDQMDTDGSFPLELNRTKPYGYSLFNLDAMATVCHILSDENHNLWQYTTEDGRNMQKGVAWLYPYIKDKSVWPFNKDVMYWDEWPVAHPALLFSACDTPNGDYVSLWTMLEHFPVNDEVVRNLPIRHPLLWL
ncbi:MULTISPECIES: alginate lyase family protein [unclassified Parabacteroides]|uniref:alginate lyase family protein n=1 Tax=unclassified Parabacteroides TaxID=2649774 RepID=UPI000EFFBB83|nr:alginate lyase family protein [Parabacteroides sp. TM07-1AC]RHU27163.1 alginate lyase [Parabacteroides sp. TM07-1AC]